MQIQGNVICKINRHIVGCSQETCLSITRVYHIANGILCTLVILTIQTHVTRVARAGIISQTSTFTRTHHSAIGIDSIAHGDLAL